MRRKLLTGRSKTVGDRGGCEVSDNDLAALWPLFLNEDMEAARPSLSMPDVEFMIEQRETWRYHSMDPRPLKDAEMTDTARLDKFTLQNGDIQQFIDRWDEPLSLMSRRPPDDDHMKLFSFVQKQSSALLVH